MHEWKRNEKITGGKIEDLPRYTRDEDKEKIIRNGKRERSGERNDRDKARRRRKRERVKRGMHAGATKTETRDRTRCSSGEVS